MKLRPEEITSILRERIEQYDVETDLAEVGTVLQVGDGIARIYGLENAVAMEMLELEHGVVGLAFNLEEDDVGAALFGEWQKVNEGEPVRRTGSVASVPVGEALLGRVVDPLGNPLDGRGPIGNSGGLREGAGSLGRDTAPSLFRWVCFDLAFQWVAGSSPGSRGRSRARGPGTPPGARRG